MAKFTLEFNDDAAKVVRNLADERHTTQSDIVRRSINLMKFVSQERKEGSKVLIQTKDGEMREIVEF